MDDWPTASDVASEDGPPDDHEGARPSSTIESEASAQEAVAAQTAQMSDPFSLESQARRKREETVPLQVHEEIVAKLRILETKRAEERERIKDLERYKEEAEGYLQHRPKLQGTSYVDFPSTIVLADEYVPPVCSQTRRAGERAEGVESPSKINLYQLDNCIKCPELKKHLHRTRISSWNAKTWSPGTQIWRKNWNLPW